MATTILHLSDLHFGVEPDGKRSATALAQRTITLRKLLEVAGSLDPRPDLVVVSGDIGWKGRAEDYEKAGEWLGELAKQLGLEHDRFEFCAGNHDIDRARTVGMAHPVGAEQADEWTRVENIDELSRLFQSYTAFREGFGLPPLEIGDRKSHLVGVRDVGGVRVVVSNSAWYCRSNEDRGRLWLGLPLLQTMSAADQTPDRDRLATEPLTLALVHHPQDWFADPDQRAYENRPGAFPYLAQRAHVVLSGHVHARPESAHTVEGGSIAVVGGASYAGIGYSNHFSVLTIDREAGQLIRTVYEWQGHEERWSRLDRQEHSIAFGSRITPEESPTLDPAPAPSAGPPEEGKNTSDTPADDVPAEDGGESEAGDEAEVVSQLVIGKVRYFRHIQAWPIRQYLDAEAWLQNFTADEKPYAVELLNSFLYFPRHVLDALFGAAFQGLSRRVRPASGSYLQARNSWRTFVDNVIVTFPRGHGLVGAEHGLPFIRRASASVGVADGQVMEPDEALGTVVRDAERGRAVRPVVFVGAFAGSADAFLATWQDKVGVSPDLDVSFQDYREVRGGQYFYCPLLCTELAAQRLEVEAPEVELVPTHTLTPEYSALVPDSRVWPETMRGDALAVLRGVAERVGIPDTGGEVPDDWKGYKALGLSVAFEGAPPPVETLGLYRWNRDGWRPLLRQ